MKDFQIMRSIDPVGEGPRYLLIDDAHSKGRHLFTLIEKPGLGGDAQAVLNLIEAAPDLLQACKVSRKAMWGLESTMDGADAILDAAITKAEEGVS